MDRINGPLDYHRYPPRDRRKPRASTPRTSAPRDAAPRAADSSQATPSAQATPHSEHVRNARRAPQPRTISREEEQLDPAQPAHLRLDPADIPERHTPPGQRRRQKGRRGRRRSTPAGPPWWKRARRCAGVLLFIGIVELAAAVLTAPDFRVQDVEVTGLDVTTPEQVRPLAQQLMGQNWVRANTKDAIAAVHQLPAVRTARIERTLQWPPQLVLRIHERRPFARVGAGDNWWVVDETGVPFRPARAEDERLYAVTSKAFRPVIGRDLPAASWQPVVTFARALSRDGSTSDGSTSDGSTSDGSTSDGSAEEGNTENATMGDGSTPGQPARQWALRRMDFDKDGFASLRLEGGAHDELLVRLGAGRWPEKLQRAHQALAWFERTGSRASELNLVSYNMPVWTPRTASGEAETAENTEAGAPVNPRRTVEPNGSLAGAQPSSREG